MNSLLLVREKNNCEFSLKENEHLSILSFNSQNRINVELCGEGAAFEYHSLTILNDEKTEQKINVAHKTPNTHSFLFARHILNGNARAEFNGTIEVYPNSKDIKSRQLVNSILLSPNAKAISKPELKIFCDEVECSHGSTCGGLDEDSLFYLQSRGLSFTQAEDILLLAFAEEVIQPSFKNEVRGLLAEAFSACKASPVS